MKTNQIQRISLSDTPCFVIGVSLSLLLLPALCHAATTHYVWQNSPSPAPPYTSWDTAAQTLQQAVDAALAGDEIVVTNGVYATGGRTAPGLVGNRVAVDKPLSVRSVNGPQATVIRGYRVPGTVYGNNAMRCAYLTNGASLSGFTLTNGATRQYMDGGDNVGGGVWCESQLAVISNCVVAGNAASNLGGGVYQGTLYDCTLVGNSADSFTNPSGYGGGAASATLHNCLVASNTALGGGGAGGCTLNNCTLTGNSAGDGGGATEGVLNNCVLTGNSAGTGGGAAGGVLNNCVLTGNKAAKGGGAVQSTLNHCTVTGNSAYDRGGGVAGGTLNNCIVYYNRAPSGSNYTSRAVTVWDVTLNYCCTTPNPGGMGNLTAEPQLADASHLTASSPCRGAAASSSTVGVDIDGEAWGQPPSIGCDEYHAGALTGPLTVRILAALTNVATGYPVDFTAFVEGRVASSVWDFGHGAVVSNRPYATHAWTTPGEYAVVLRAYNDTYPAGVGTTQMIHVVAQPVHYVAATSPSPSAPYDSWATAARTIQAAVDAATLPGALVLVSNGVYATGGRVVYGTLQNRVAVTKPLTVRSVNGPQFTVIQGYQVPGTTNGDGAIRCAYLTNGATLSGFTLTRGGTRSAGDFQREQSGGGIYCESAMPVVSNCVLDGNAARTWGGGAYGGTLNDCILTGNSGGYPYGGEGGGAGEAVLNHCTLTNNLGWSGGGATRCELNYCTVVNNSAPRNGGGGVADSILNYCVVAGNRAATQGGGAARSYLTGCTVSDNSISFSGRDGGGGAFGCTVNNSILSRNTSTWDGGGAMSCTLNNCTLVGNSCARSGGGMWSGTMNNCIVYYNTAATGANYPADSWDGAVTFDYCCTIPLPTNGLGNITHPPLFLDQAGGNLRLQPNSPCINAGRNAYAPGLTDLDGNPRIVRGTVDIGAYEFQGPGSMISYAWLQQYNLPTDGSADLLDPDADGHDTWQEWRCLTVPTNALSVLRLLTATPAGTNVTVSWQSVAGVNYFLERSTSLGSPLLFTPLATGIPGQPGTTTFTDTNAFTAPRLFYRVGVGD